MGKPPVIPYQPGHKQKRTAKREKAAGSALRRLRKE